MGTSFTKQPNKIMTREKPDMINRTADFLINIDGYNTFDLIDKIKQYQRYLGNNMRLIESILTNKQFQSYEPEKQTDIYFVTGYNILIHIQNSKIKKGIIDMVMTLDLDMLTHKVEHEMDIQYY